MIRGARAALGKAADKEDPRKPLAVSCGQTLGAAVALANKKARIVWAILSGSKFYEVAPWVKAA